MQHQEDKFWSYKKEIKETNAIVCGEGLITLSRPMVESSRGRPNDAACPCSVAGACPRRQRCQRPGARPRCLPVRGRPRRPPAGARPRCPPAAPEAPLGACPLPAGAPLGARPLARRPEFPRLTGMRKRWWRVEGGQRRGAGVTEADANCGRGEEADAACRSEERSWAVEAR
jgi:hypothetical protein